MEFDVLLGKAAVFVLMASFIYGFVKPDRMDMRDSTGPMDRLMAGMLAVCVGICALGVLIAGGLGVLFLLS